MDAELGQKLTAYAEAYLQQFNTLCEGLATLASPAPLYAARIAAAAVVEASNGVAIFYFSDDAARLHDLKQAITMFSATNYTLSYYLQAKSLNYIKILLPSQEPLRANLSNLNLEGRLPPDISLEELDEKHSSAFSPELRASILDAPDTVDMHLSGIAISPVTHYEQGIARYVVPTRAHIFSPAVTLHDGTVVRQYVWPFADLLWEANGLNLDPKTAARLATADVQALILGIEAGIPQEQLMADPAESVSRHLLKVCQEFEILINGAHVGEAAIQAFLEQPGHAFLVSPVHLDIWPRRRLGGGKYIPDFTILRPNGEYHFVEIETPSTPIYHQASNAEMSQHLTHALTQVKDWLRYVEQNRDTIRREDGLSTINYPTAEVTAGRDAHLSPLAAARFSFDQKELRNSITLRTFDALLSEARAYALVVKSLKEGIVSGTADNN